MLQQDVRGQVESLESLLLLRNQDPAGGDHSHEGWMERGSPVCQTPQVGVGVTEGVIHQSGPAFSILLA